MHKKLPFVPSMTLTTTMFGLRFPLVTLLMIMACWCALVVPSFHHMSTTTVMLVSAFQAMPPLSSSSISLSSKTTLFRNQNRNNVVYFRTTINSIRDGACHHLSNQVKNNKISKKKRRNTSCHEHFMTGNDNNNDDSNEENNTTNNDDTKNDDNDASISLPKLKRKLTKEFLSIGFPAFIQLVAEPLASLVDTAYLGRLGPEVLGGAGVAISAQYAVSKLYNDPLLRTSISLVASQDGKTRKRKDDGTSSSEGSSLSTQQQKDEDDKELSFAVSSALLLAFVVGMVQCVLYTVLAAGITRGMGLTRASPMWHSAVSYLRIRALGTPAATLWLVTNGIFRGLGDTKTPLSYSLCFTALNAILDPIFIFSFQFGASGAAAGTALAQYVALVPLLFALNDKVPIRIWGRFKQLGSSLKSYLEAGGFVFFRTLGKVLAYSVCARQAALLGSVAAAAYNLTFQLGFATTQICEAVAVAVQTLLAREMADTKTYSPSVKSKVIRHLINTSIIFGGGVATVLSLTTYLQQTSILRGLTTNLQVRAASQAIFPVVLVTQVFKGLAYPVNGIIMGGLDWIFTMLAMWAANIVCVGMIRGWAVTSANGAVTLGQLWWALAAFMGTQVVTGIARYQSKTGPWKVLNEEE